MPERRQPDSAAIAAEADREARSAAWSRYWSSGALHSCPGSFAGNYDQALAAFWRSVFDGLPAGARVLDIGCGNGPLELLMLETLGAARLPWVDAVDLARPLPPFMAAQPASVAERLRFHPEVAAESLPFEVGRFDLAISQYGIEYSDLTRSITELRRVLKPDAGVALVLHHEHSLPVRRGRDELVHLEWLLAERGLLSAARALLPWLAELSRPGGRERLQASAAAASDREAYNRAVRALAQRAATEATPDSLHETQAAVAAVLSLVAAHGLDAGQRALDSLRAELELARLRQSELVACALDSKAVDQLVHNLSGRGARVGEVGEVRIQEELFGWTLRLHR